MKTKFFDIDSKISSKIDERKMKLESANLIDKVFAEIEKQNFDFSLDDKVTISFVKNFLPIGCKSLETAKKKNDVQLSTYNEMITLFQSLRKELLEMENKRNYQTKQIFGFVVEYIKNHYDRANNSFVNSAVKNLYSRYSETCKCTKIFQVEPDENTIGSETKTNSKGQSATTFYKSSKFSLKGLKSAINSVDNIKTAINKANSKEEFFNTYDILRLDADLLACSPLFKKTINNSPDKAKYLQMCEFADINIEDYKIK